MDLRFAAATYGCQTLSADWYVVENNSWTRLTSRYREHRAAKRARRLAVSEWPSCPAVCCLTSQQRASVSQGRFVCCWLLDVPATCECISGTDLIRSDYFTCRHTEIEVADQTFYLTQSQYTDTGPTSPNADPITPGAWQGSHWSASFKSLVWLDPGKIPAQAGFEPGIFRSRGGRLTTRPTRRSQGRICSDNFTCCHTEIEVADPTFHLTQSQYTDTGPTSPSTDPITPGAWQGSHF